MGKVLVVGTGEAGREICHRLKRSCDFGLALMGGNLERVRWLSSRFGASPLSYDNLPEALLEADAVLSASPRSAHIMEAEEMEDIMRRRDYRPLLVIDISVPRDFPQECGSIPGVTLVGIEDLSTNHVLPKGVEEEVRKELDTALVRMSHFLAEREKTPAIVSIRTEAEKIWKEEMERLWRKLDLKDPQKQEIIEESVRKTVNRVLHRPILLIKREEHHVGPTSRRASGDHLTH
jgi:glutamyl-tRNA reductase